MGRTKAALQHPFCQWVGCWKDGMVTVGDGQYCQHHADVIERRSELEEEVRDEQESE